MMCGAVSVDRILNIKTFQMFSTANQHGGKLKLTWRSNSGILILLSADGVALGAAASTSQTSVQLIVFVAIMLHKVS